MNTRWALLCAICWLANAPKGLGGDPLPPGYAQELGQNIQSVLVERSKSPAEKELGVSQLRDGMAIRYLTELENKQAWEEYAAALRAYQVDDRFLSPSTAAKVFARAAKLLAQSNESDFRALAADFAATVLRQMGTASLTAQDESMLVLVGKYLPQLGRAAPLDWVDRQAALSSYLNLIQSVELHLERPRPSVEQSHTWKPGRTILIDPAVARDDEEKARFEFAIKAYHKHQDEYRVFSEDDSIRYYFGNTSTGRRPKLEKEMSAFINKRYSMSTEDLIELQQLFEKHIRSPELRQRLILATFNGTNPFLGLAGPVQAAKRSSWLDQFRTQKEREQSAAVAATKQSTTTSGTEHRSEASNPLASTSGGGAGRILLWLTFAGATALIVLLFWRAQLRRTSGGPK